MKSKSSRMGKPSSETQRAEQRTLDQVLADLSDHLDQLNRAILDLVDRRLPVKIKASFRKLRKCQELMDKLSKRFGAPASAEKVASETEVGIAVIRKHLGM